MAKKKKARVLRVRRAGLDHAVISIHGGEGGHCTKPCATCPWRKDAVGEFPAEAFRHSAPTAYDAAMEQFACHSAGKDKAYTCAGFLLKNSVHNLATRIHQIDGKIDFSKVSDGGVELFDSYREMAIANGVDPNDPVLKKCRANDD